MTSAHSHRHEDATSQPAAGQKDPVCGMSVSRESPHRAQQGGDTHYFCSARCLSKFTADPARYVNPHAGHRHDVLSTGHLDPRIHPLLRPHLALADGSEFEGRVIGKDPQNDLAVLKVDNPPANARALQAGDSAALRVGQTVLAMFFAFDSANPSGVLTSTPMSSRHTSVLFRSLNLSANFRTIS